LTRNRSAVILALRYRAETGEVVDRFRAHHDEVAVEDVNLDQARPVALSVDPDRDVPHEVAYWGWDGHTWTSADFWEQSCV
jgi:cytochrome oxidase Cu insertion factor (SCO1/SenC/PrrC family)